MGFTVKCYAQIEAATLYKYVIVIIIIIIRHSDVKFVSFRMGFSVYEAF